MKNMGNYNRKVNEMLDNSIVLNNGVKIPQLGKLLRMLIRQENLRQLEFPIF